MAISIVGTPTDDVGRESFCRIENRSRIEVLDQADGHSSLGGTENQDAGIRPCGTVAWPRRPNPVRGIDLSG